MKVNVTYISYFRNNVFVAIRIMCCYRHTITPVFYWDLQFISCIRVLSNLMVNFVKLHCCQILVESECKSRRVYCGKFIINDNGWICESRALYSLIFSLGLRTRHGPYVIKYLDFFQIFIWYYSICRNCNCCHTLKEIINKCLSISLILN